MADIEGLKQYLRLENDEEQLNMYLAAAKNYALHAGVTEPESDSPLYDLLIYMLACHWYDNRGVQTVGSNVNDLSLSVNSLILQLRNEALEDDTKNMR